MTPLQGKPPPLIGLMVMFVVMVVAYLVFEVFTSIIPLLWFGILFWFGLGGREIWAKVKRHWQQRGMDKGAD